MPGALAPARYRPPTLNARPEAATPHDVGLSDFPDQAYLYADTSGLGNIFTDIGSAIPGVGTAVQGGTIANDLLGALTGGSVVDQQRQARVNYFLQLAEGGNVGAAQIMIGGPNNTASKEAQMWQNAITQLNSTAIGRQTLQAAQSQGSYWPAGSTDTATNYPIMRAYAANWASQNTVGAALSNAGTLATGAIIRSGGLSPLLILGAVGVGAAIFLHRRK